MGSLTCVLRKACFSINNFTATLCSPWGYQYHSRGEYLLEHQQGLHAHTSADFRLGASYMNFWLTILFDGRITFWGDDDGVFYPSRRPCHSTIILKSMWRKIDRREIHRLWPEIYYPPVCIAWSNKSDRETKIIYYDVTTSKAFRTKKSGLRA